MRRILVGITGFLLILTIAACNAPVAPPGPLPPTGGTQVSPAAATQAAAVLPPVEEIVTLVPDAAQTTSTPASRPVDGDIEAFGRQLAEVVQARDFNAMQSLMGSSFSFVTMDTSLYAYSADESLNLLRQAAFAGGSAPVLRFDADVAAILGGRDPLGEWGPVAQPVRAVFVSGLGSDGQGEGVLVIARSPDTGGFYWLGILFPKQGSRFSSGE